MTKRRLSEKKTKPSSKEATDKARLSLILLFTGVILVAAGLLHSLGYF
ncbi:MAG: hypothetical protein ACXVIG_05470 [Halobacteriota archaeon]